MKRIVICFDGTWNRPEEDPKDDRPTNVLQFARSIRPSDDAGTEQVVFYDWGIGSYHAKLSGGGLGAGLEKNVTDGYRFLVHNYEPGDEIYLFGFSRGAYTARSLCGLLNNCSILKKQYADQIEPAFKLYKTKKHKPNSDHSIQWKRKHSVSEKVSLKFVGVWDTVGSLGLPFTFFGLIERKDLFYDRGIGSNIECARHALALDEFRDDFQPTLWEPKAGADLGQVWFVGAHSDVGGGYKKDDDGKTLADIPLVWMADEAAGKGLMFAHLDEHRQRYNSGALVNAELHNEYTGVFKLLGERIRQIPDPAKNRTFIHPSVKQRYASGYSSPSIEDFVKKHGQWPPLWEPDQA